MNSTEPSTDDTEELIGEIRDVLYEGDCPLSRDTIITRTGTEDVTHLKKALRKMIERGMIGTTPNWEYRLSTRERRRLQTESENTRDHQ